MSETNLVDLLRKYSDKEADRNIFNPTLLDKEKSSSETEQSLTQNSGSYSKKLGTITRKCIEAFKEKSPKGMKKKTQQQEMMSQNGNRLSGLLQIELVEEEEDEEAAEFSRTYEEILPISSANLVGKSAIETTTNLTCNQDAVPRHVVSSSPAVVEPIQEEKTGNNKTMTSGGSPRRSSNLSTENVLLCPNHTPEDAFTPPAILWSPKPAPRLKIHRYKHKPKPTLRSFQHRSNEQDKKLNDSKDGSNFAETNLQKSKMQEHPLKANKSNEAFDNASPSQLLPAVQHQTANNSLKSEQQMSRSISNIKPQSVRSTTKQSDPKNQEGMDKNLQQVLEARRQHIEKSSKPITHDIEDINSTQSDKQVTKKLVPGFNETDPQIKKNYITEQIIAVNSETSKATEDTSKETSEYKIIPLENVASTQRKKSKDVRKSDLDKAEEGGPSALASKPSTFNAPTLSKKMAQTLTTIFSSPRKSGSGNQQEDLLQLLEVSRKEKRKKSEMLSDEDLKRIQEKEDEEVMEDHYVQRIQKEEKEALNQSDPENDKLKLYVDNAFVVTNANSDEVRPNPMPSPKGALGGFRTRLATLRSKTIKRKSVINDNDEGRSRTKSVGLNKEGTQSSRLAKVRRAVSMKVTDTFRRKKSETGRLKTEEEEEALKHIIGSPVNFRKELGKDQFWHADNDSDIFLNVATPRRKTVRRESNSPRPPPSPRKPATGTFFQRMSPLKTGIKHQSPKGETSVRFVTATAREKRLSAHDFETLDLKPDVWRSWRPAEQKFHTTGVGMKKIRESLLLDDWETITQFGAMTLKRKESISPTSHIYEEISDQPLSRDTTFDDILVEGKEYQFIDDVFADITKSIDDEYAEEESLEENPENRDDYALEQPPKHDGNTNEIDEVDAKTNFDSSINTTTTFLTPNLTHFEDITSPRLKRSGQLISGKRPLTKMLKNEEYVTMTSPVHGTSQLSTSDKTAASVEISPNVSSIQVEAAGPDVGAETKQLKPEPSGLSGFLDRLVHGGSKKSKNSSNSQNSSPGAPKHKKKTRKATKKKGNSKKSKDTLEVPKFYSPYPSSDEYSFSDQSSLGLSNDDTTYHGVISIHDVSDNEDSITGITIFDEQPMYNPGDKGDITRNDNDVGDNTKESNFLLQLGQILQNKIQPEVVDDVSDNNEVQQNDTAAYEGFAFLPSSPTPTDHSKTTELKTQTPERTTTSENGLKANYEEKSNERKDNSDIYNQPTIVQMATAKDDVDVLHDVIYDEPMLDGSTKNIYGEDQNVYLNPLHVDSQQEEFNKTYEDETYNHPPKDNALIKYGDTKNEMKTDSINNEATYKETANYISNEEIYDKPPEELNITNQGGLRNELNKIFTSKENNTSQQTQVTGYAGNQGKPSKQPTVQHHFGLFNQLTKIFSGDEQQPESCDYDDIYDIPFEPDKEKDNNLKESKHDHPSLEPGPKNEMAYAGQSGTQENQQAEEMVDKNKTFSHFQTYGSSPVGKDCNLYERNRIYDQPLLKQEKQRYLFPSNTTNTQSFKTFQKPTDLEQLYPEMKKDIQEPDEDIYDLPADDEPISTHPTKTIKSAVFLPVENYKSPNINNELKNKANVETVEVTKNTVYNLNDTYCRRQDMNKEEKCGGPEYSVNALNKSPAETNDKLSVLSKVEFAYELRRILQQKTGNMMTYSTSNNGNVVKPEVTASYVSGQIAPPSTDVSGDCDQIYDLPDDCILDHCQVAEQTAISTATSYDSPKLSPLTPESNYLPTIDIKGSVKSFPHKSVEDVTEDCEVYDESPETIYDLPPVEEQPGETTRPESYNLLEQIPTSSLHQNLSPNHVTPPKNLPGVSYNVLHDNIRRRHASGVENLYDDPSILANYSVNKTPVMVTASMRMSNDDYEDIKDDDDDYVDVSEFSKMHSGATPKHPPTSQRFFEYDFLNRSGRFAQPSTSEYVRFEKILEIKHGQCCLSVPYITVSKLAAPTMDSGDIFVSDCMGDCIDVYGSNGEHKSTINVAGNPRGLTSQTLRNVLCTSCKTGEISVMDTTKGAVTRQIGKVAGLTSPRYITMHPENQAFVASDISYLGTWSLPMFDLRTGDIVMSLTSSRSKTKMSWPEFLTIRHGSDQLYVSDSENNCIFVYDIRRADIAAMTIGKKGSEDGELLHPCGVAYITEGNITHTSAPGGSVLVSDWGNNRISAFDAVNGEYQCQLIGADGSQTAETLDMPYDITVDIKGIVYLTESQTNNIKVFKGV
ncbi:uncharacterized protein LOC143470148 [Clavelina lepadiformis]|uniref:uncharacterized protein LOC143470148 n=1 Tax=Clavelina lepadiformis TaxID=159417 RepID=UPI0040422CB1